MDLELRKTKDGSHTLYRPDLNEAYHSIHGAVQESQHVFIENGLNYILKKLQLQKINVYELGFGTGLNALLTLQLSICQNVLINYCTSEKYVINNKVIDKINFEEYLYPETIGYFKQLHEQKPNKWNKIHSNFELFIDTNDIISAEIQSNHFHLVYFDAFAPNKQPELWTVEIFKKMYQALKENGVLVTYCAKGQVKRDLRSVGFEVETLPGPRGKREMIRATKI